MKCIVVLFDEENLYENQKVFENLSAVDLTFRWAEELKSAGDISAVKIIKKSECGSVTELLEKLKILAAAESADFIVYSYIDLPFINAQLTKELISSHLEYKAEYTFADGFPYGLSPEVIDKGTCAILSELAKTTQATLGEKTVKRDSLWELLKTDINSFEVESILADEDFRLLRYSFDCSSKLNFEACKNLYAKAKDEKDVNKLSSIASELPEVLKTVPSFYNIQICDSVNVDSIYCPYVQEYEKKTGTSPFTTDKFMSIEKFKTLVKQINDLSGKAVISLSAFGEAFNHPDLAKLIGEVLSYPDLSVFIETDGIKVTEDFCKELKKIIEAVPERNNGYSKVMIAVTVDGAEKETYKTIHKSDVFDKALEAINLLEAVIPHNVYPQFTRMNQNEQDLEKFYRYWSDKNSPSFGELIIQKYDSYAGLMPDYKPADLSPIDRNVCWHLRRDVTVLTDGNVPLCKEYVLDNIVGNVFSDGLEKVWKAFDQELKNHINKSYCKKCGCCDEFYTFQF